MPAAHLTCRCKEDIEGGLHFVHHSFKLFCSAYQFSSVGSSCETGLGGHHLKSSKETSALVSSSSDVDNSSSEEGSATASPAPSGSGGLPARG